MNNDWLIRVRNGENLSLRDQFMLIFKLSYPAILAQLSSILMSCIDTSMVGHLGELEAAAIGLVSSSTWLFCGFCFSCAMGFTVQTAHLIGAGMEDEARNLLKISFIVCGCFVFFLTAGLLIISPFLPVWLGGNQAIYDNAFIYFFIFALSLPVVQFNNLAAGMLQCSGDMKFPAVMQIVMAVLNIFFNWIFIYVLHMGVKGAAIATFLARFVSTLGLVLYLLFKSNLLKLRKNEKLIFKIEYIIKAIKIGIPVAVEQGIMSGGQVAFTRIVSVLGSTALAANSMAITAESLCYMPAYGLGAAATTLAGQCYGAERKDLTYRFGWLTTWSGIVLMFITGLCMYFFAKEMIGFLCPDPAIIELGAKCLMIEALCEPLYGASLVSNGALRGTGDTFVPSCFKLVTMWLIRLPLALFLSGKYGLEGIWMAMSFELCIRGALFLFRLWGREWLK